MGGCGFFVPLCGRSQIFDVLHKFLELSYWQDDRSFFAGFIRDVLGFQVFQIYHGRFSGAGIFVDHSICSVSVLPVVVAWAGQI